MLVSMVVKKIVSEFEDRLGMAIENSAKTIFGAFKKCRFQVELCL